MSTTTHAEGVFGPLKDGLAVAAAWEMLVVLLLVGVLVGLGWGLWWALRGSR